MQTLIFILIAFLGYRYLRSQPKPFISTRPPIVPVPIEVTPPSPMVVPSLNSDAMFRINRYTGFITDTASQLGIDPNLLRALIYTKSGGDDMARFVSPDGEYGYGLTQITCGRARMMPQPASSTSTVDKIVNSADCQKLIKPENSIWYGAAYLRAIYRPALGTEGDWEEALAKYNSPSNAIILNPDAFSRAREILLIAGAFRGIGG